MRAAFGLVGLVVVLALVGMLVKKQMAAARVTVPAVQNVSGAGTPASAPAPVGTVRAQSQQVQQQVKQQMESLMQQARPMPEDEK